jgi:glutaredoxin
MKKVSMYTLSTCPWCYKTKKFFTEHNCPFDFTDYDLADEETQNKIMRELESIGAHGFPVVWIDDQVVIGYQLDRYAQLLGI